MEWAVVLPIVGFLAIATVVAIVLRRAGRIVARTREVEAFRRSVRDLGERIEQSLDGAIGRIDALRRHQDGPEAIAETLSAAADAVRRYIEEARALHGPPPAAAIRDDILQELERAGRALEMVEHGAEVLASARRGNRELEAQTSIKRGYLNLLHAREAIARHAARAAELDPGQHRPPATVQRNA
ncbi:MAG: hypothetical protein ACJ761_09115 [Chloroflexota bacterium]